MLSVVIVAPSPVLRAGLAALIEDATLRVAAQVASLEGQAAPLDVAVIASAGWQDELGYIAELEEQPGVVVLVDNPAAMPGIAGLDLPGWAVLPPSASDAQLRAGIRAAAAGLVSMPSELWQQATRQARTAVEALVEPLTPREEQVLQLISEGLSNKLIARQLTISEHTVKFHVSSIYAKLEAANRTEAVSHAARRGLVTL